MALIYRRKNIRVVIGFVMLVIIVLVLNRKYIFSSKRGIEKNPLLENKQPDSFIPVLVAPKIKNTNESRGYSLEEMRNQARMLNFKQTVKNKMKFGDHQPDDIVIVIQVHDRPKLFNMLLKSLRKVKGIESVTLILSRDKFTSEMDEVIDNNIDFCRYIEVFFPFSMQLYPDKFPGEDPNDCPRDLTKSAARAKKCINAEYPDMYGHYREVKYVQIKHHWFWKFNMVFAGIREIQDSKSPILMLEDDNYVVPDVIDVIRKAVALRDAECNDCLVISLGNYAKTAPEYKEKGGEITIEPWVSSKHNLGMVLNRKFYEKLAECSKYFCSYDDYNWDWSLQSTGLMCIKENIHTLALKAARVYHLGCDGFHEQSRHHGKCDIDDDFKKIEKFVEKESNNLNLSTMRIVSTNKAANSAHNQNGGWGDIRDHELCQTYVALSKTYMIV